MWVGAFSSPSSMCCHGQSSETIRSSAASKSRATAGSACSLIVTPGGRVRDVDECGRGAVEIAERRAHQLGDVHELAPLLRRHAELAHGAYPRQPWTGTPSDRELDGYRAGADRFIAELDEEYYLHYAGLKPEFELRPIYERHADLTDLATVRRVGEAVDGAKNRELFPLRLRGLPRRAHARARGEDRRARGDARDAARRRGGRLPDAAADDREHGRPRHARAARGGPERADRGAPEPALPRCRRTTQRAIPELGAPTYFHLYRDRFQYDLEGLAAQCRAFLDSTERLYEDSMDRVLRERVGIGPRRGGALGRAPLLPRLRLGRRLPRRPDAAGPARHARRPRDRPRLAGATSTSTSRSGRRRARAPSAPRSRSRTR